MKKENEQIVKNSAKLVSAASDLQVKDRETQEVRDITRGEEAYFALLAKDMMRLGNQYGCDVNDVHRIFYEVSCDRDSLVKVLKAKQKGVDSGVIQWNTLEDLAIRQSEDNKAYIYVEKNKGEDEVRKRQKFLQVASPKKKTAEEKDRDKEKAEDKAK